jgi:hypothetical protein
MLLKQLLHSLTVVRMGLKKGSVSPGNGTSTVVLSLWFWFSGQGADMRLILLSFCTYTYGGKFILRNGEY